MILLLVDRGNRLSATSQFTRLITCQIDVSVQDIKNELAYAFHEFLVTVTDYGLTQFLFGRPEYVKGVIIRFHSIHHLSANRHWSVLPGIYRFENAGDHRYPVTHLELGNRGVDESRPGRP